MVTTFPCFLEAIDPCNIEQNHRSHGIDSPHCATVSGRDSKLKPKFERYIKAENMDYHLDHRIELSTERDHKNLYSWSIKEIDKNGDQIGQDQIPWNWSLAFEAIELNPTYRLEIKEHDSSPEQGDAPTANPSSELTNILRGKLRPRPESRQTGIYSMLGTRRRIDEFGLLVYRAKQGERECCRLWGSPSYTAEWDFQNRTEPDCIQLYVYLASDNFDQLMKLVKQPSATAIDIRLKGVSGFYSEWSPSIRTKTIKVLANANDQQLLNPQQLPFEAPALGFVREFEISAKKQSSLIFQAQSSEQHDGDETATLPAVPFSDEQFRSTLLAQVGQLKKNFGRMQLVLWLILVVVGLHLFK